MIYIENLLCFLQCTDMDIIDMHRGFLEKQQITTILIISRAHTVMLFLVFEYLSPSVLLLDWLFLVLLHRRENCHVATGINDS